MTRGTRTQAVIAAGLLCFSPLVAKADAAADARLAAMEQRMTQLEDKLATSEQTIAEQAELLKTQATPAVSAGSEAAQIDAFLSKLSVGGYVTASYVYNANNPDNPVYAQALNQFNLNHNTFNLDAAEIDFSVPAAEAGDAGFELDMMFGDNAGILGGYRFNTPGYASDNFVEVKQMFVTYNWNDVLFKFGKFVTLMGSEVIDEPYNKNVTQGVLFTYAIPLFHTGVLASSKFNEEWGWALGVMNGWNNSSDLNDNKGVTGQINLATGPLSTAFTAYYGSDGNTGTTAQTVNNFNTDRAFLVDWASTLAVNDALSFWWNVDWGYQNDVQFTNGPLTGRQMNAHWYGGALGTFYKFTEKASVAVRGEVLRDGDGYRMVAGRDVTAYTLTGTLGYQLTDNLLARFEVRYDDLHADQTSQVSGYFPQGGCAGFGSGCGSDRDLQYIVNVAYVFD